MTPPATAFLILAHQHPAQLERLVARLQAPWSRIFIHVDLKANQAIFEAALAGLNVTFVPHHDRMDVRWGSLSVCQAILKLVRMALPHAKRLCLLSGSDYPAKSIHEIGKAFSSATEFMRIDRRLDFAVAGEHRDFVRHYHFNGFKYLNARSGSQLLRHLLRRPWDILNRRFPRKAIDLPLFHGSCWWALTQASAQHVLTYIDMHMHFIPWFKLTSCPDEIVVQSLIRNSPYAAHIMQDVTRDEDIPSCKKNLYGCHYVDWSQIELGGPRTLTFEDLPEIEKSGALFVRKIDPLISATLLDQLDKDASSYVQESLKEIS